MFLQDDPKPGLLRATGYIVLLGFFKGFFSERAAGSDAFLESEQTWESFCFSYNILYVNRKKTSTCIDPI